MGNRLPIPSIARILVVRSLPGIGDLLCSVPALRSLRSAYPLASITWLGLPGTEWFGKRFAHLIDDWLPFPGFPGIPEGWQGAEATVEFLQFVQTLSFDLTLQIHGSGIYINPFLTLMGGQLRAGFYLPGQFCPDADFFIPYPQTLPEVERLLQLMTFLGLPDQGTALEFPLNADEYQAGLRLLDAHSLTPGEYVCLHPGASSRDRCWEPTEFARVAQQISAKGYRIVLTGTGGERDLADQVIAQLEISGQRRPVNLAGRTCLGGLAVLLQHSALLICNDTGISHLAAALEVPSVVVFSNSEVQRWAPGDSRRHRVIDRRQAQAATAPTVLAAALDLLHLQPVSTQVTEEAICHAR